MKKLLTLMLAVVMILSFASVAMAAEKTVELNTNNRPWSFSSSTVDLALNDELTINGASDAINITYKVAGSEESASFVSPVKFGVAGTYTVTATDGADNSATLTVNVAAPISTVPTVKVGEATYDAEGEFSNIAFLYADESVVLNITAPANCTIESVKVGETAITGTSGNYTVAVGNEATVTVKVTVKPASGTEATYDLVLKRGAASTETVPTVKYKVDGGEVQTATLSGTKYAVEANYTAEKVAFTITPPVGGRIVVTVGGTPYVSYETLTPSVDVKNLKNTDEPIDITVEVLAQDTTVPAVVYTIEVSKAAPSNLTVFTPDANPVEATQPTVAVDYEVSPGAKVVTEGEKKYSITGVLTSDLSTPVTGASITSVTSSKINVAGLKNGATYTVTVYVLAEDGTTYSDAQTFTIVAEITTPLLDALYLSSGTSSFGNSILAANDFAYEKEITNSTYYVGFKYDSTAYDVAVKLNGKAISSISTSGSISYVKLTGLGQQMKTLDDTVTIDVSVKGGTTKTTYTIDLTKLDDIDGSAIVDEMHISSSSTKTSSTYTKYFYFDPYFHVERLDYDVLIDEDYEEDYIYIHFEADDDFDVTVSGATKIEAEDKGSYVEYVYRIATPATNKEVKVEIEVVYDRKSGSDDENTYELTFCYEASSDAFLDDVDAYIGTISKRGSAAAMFPAFNKDITEYVILMPYDSSSKYIYFDIEEGKDCDFEADSDLERDKIGNTYYYIDSVSTGETTYTIEAINDDSGETTDYKFTVIRAKDKADDECDLEDLVLRTKTSTSKYAISLDKAFSSSTYKYSATVDEDQKKVYVYADAEDTDAIVIVNGEICGSYVDVELEKGSNTIEVVCAAENCDDVKTYTITVFRGEGSSELTGLTLYNGNTSFELSPKFSKTGFAYTTTVANSIKGVYIAPTTDAAYVSVKNTATGVSTTINKNSEVGYLALNEGLNSLTLTTVGSDLSVNVYHVAVWRQPAKIAPTVSAQNLTVDGKAKTLSTYLINGNNFIKLRDLAALLDGTDKEFAISDSASTKKVTMTSGSSYKKLGTELSKLPAAKSSVATAWSFYLDGTQVKFTAYNIDGANYVMLRDMALFMDFGLTYNGTTKTIAIDTDDNYTPGK